MNKNELANAIMEFVNAEGKVEVNEKIVEAVLRGQASVVQNVARKHGEVTIPGLVKVHVTETKATAERTMYSKLAGREIVIPAKPAGHKVSLKVIKALKETV